MSGGEAVLETVVVYDDDAGEAPRRGERVTALLERLVDEGVLASMPQVQVATLKVECFRSLENSGPAILIADLMSIKRQPKGARLLRAVASREDVAERTWRIALTMRSHPLIAAGLDSYAHALVVYRRKGKLEALGEALAGVLARPAGARGPTLVFPPSIRERRSQDTEAVEALLGEHYDKELEDAAFRAIADPAPGMVAEEDLSKDPQWRKVNDSLKRLYAVLREKWGPWPTESLREELYRHLYAVSRKGVWEQIAPEVTGTAFSPSGLWLRNNRKRFIEETWLSPQEIDVASAFLLSAEAQGLKDPMLNSNKPFEQIDRALADPGFLEVLEEKGMNRWDACYVMLAISDWWFDAKDLEMRGRLDGED